MVVSNTRGSDLIWEAIDHEDNRWFKSNISLLDFSPVSTTDEEVSKKLQSILKTCINQNSEFLSNWSGFKIQTFLEFDRSWGLGSSSSLYCLIAEWAEINPLLLYFAVEEGSGYDVACGWAEGPLTYINSPEEVSYKEVDFLPAYRDNLYFVYTGQKKNSHDAIQAYKKKKISAATVSEISSITDEILTIRSLSKFEDLINRHEAIISELIGEPMVKDRLFDDYWGSVKSLGAWGGDFVLVTSEKSALETKAYFKRKGLQTVFKYDDLILSTVDAVTP